MTEDEAKTKWCCGTPMLLLALAEQAGDEVFPGDGKCVASACMAWRTRLEKVEDGDAVPGGVYTKAPMVRTGGYCGLAGTP